MRSKSGAATVEHAAISLLIALLLAAAVAALASGAGERRARARLDARPQAALRRRRPRPCWRDPLTLAYGRSLAGAVRALAPAPVARPGPRERCAAGRLPPLPLGDLRRSPGTGRGSPPRTGGDGVRLGRRPRAGSVIRRIFHTGSTGPC